MTIFPSIRVFSNESAIHIRWPKYWSFSFSISPSSEYSGLISFRIDRLDLLSNTTFRNGKMMTCPILCKQWHRWREELKDGRKQQWEKRDARVTAGLKRPHLGVCPGPNVPLQGRQRSRGCILDAPEESDLISRCSRMSGSR